MKGKDQNLEKGVLRSLERGGKESNGIIPKERRGSRKKKKFKGNIYFYDMLEEKGKSCTRKWRRKCA